MPHKCTRCQRVFKDGADILLNGCPSCGWNKFLFVKEMETLETIKNEVVLNQAGEKIIQEIDKVLGKKVLELREPLAPKELENQNRLEGKLGEEELKSEAPQGISLKPSPKRIELDRVESVRILAPGSYEVNLESLFEREEIVMALKEDGTYIIHLPSAFGRKKH